MLRDIPAWGAYFWSYEFLKVKSGIADDENSGRSLTRSQITMKMFIGGMSGQLSWLISYPFDIISTLMKTNDGSQTMR